MRHKNGEESEVKGNTTSGYPTRGYGDVGLANQTPHQTYLPSLDYKIHRYVFSVGRRQKAMEHHLDVFALSPVRKRKKKMRNSYVIHVLFKKSRIHWISSGV